MDKKDKTNYTSRAQSSIKLSPDELDNIIQRWDETKKKIKSLQETEEKYRLVIGKIMDNFEIDAIHGKGLKVSRYNINKRFLIRENIPEEIYNKYSVKKQVTCYRISKK